MFAIIRSMSKGELKKKVYDFRLIDDHFWLHEMKRHLKTLEIFTLTEYQSN